MLHVFHMDVAYVALVIYVCCKCMFQCFTCFKTYVASVLFRYCICYNDYTHMLQMYGLIVSPCFSMLQHVLFPTRSDLRISTHCTRRPYITRHDSTRWSMQPVQHMCMRVVLSPPLSRIGAHTLCSNSH
jgi:hypothetical protein